MYYVQKWSIQCQEFTLVGGYYSQAVSWPLSERVPAKVGSYLFWEKMRQVRHCGAAQLL